MTSRFGPRIRGAALCAATLLAVVTPVAHARPGDVLDTFALPGGAPANDVATGADGAAVVAAGASLVLLNPTNGHPLSTSSIPGGGPGRSVAIDPQGRILVGGGDGALKVWRFSASGALDTSWGAGGTASAPGGQGRDVAAAPDGGAVVAGTSGDVGAVARFGPDGGGTAFGARTFSRGFTTTANTALVQADGKVLIAGEGLGGFGITNAYVARYTASGALDDSFSGDGVFDYYRGGSGFKSFYSLGFQDGKILAVGADNIADPIGGIPADPVALFLRLTAAGAPDPTFGGNGGPGITVLQSARGGGRTDLGPRDVTLAGGGRVVGAGDFADGAVSEGGAWALEPGGAPVTSFGNADADTLGVSSTAVFPQLSGGRGVAVAGSGDILVSGGGSVLRVSGFGPPPPADPGPGSAPGPGPPPGPGPLPGPLPRPGLSVAKLGPKFKLSAIARNGVLVRARCDRACGLRISLLIPLSTAKKLGLRKGARIGKSLVIGDARASLKNAGRARVRVRLGRHAKATILRQRSLRLSLRVAAYNKAGRRVVNRALRFVR